jgi:hypothetical protein
MAYLQDFHHAKTAEDKAAVVDKYTREHLDMTADVVINNDNQIARISKFSSWKKILQIPEPRQGCTAACRRLHVSSM